MLVILQFDSASSPLLDRLVDDGQMPTLAALRADGVRVPIDAQATFLQSSTYMTLCTGVDVREHGIYSAVPWSAGEQRPRFMYEFPHPPTIWERIGATPGLRSLVVDPILAWAPESMSGVFLGGWQFEDRMSARGLSLPARVQGRLSRRHGRAPRLDDVYGTRSAATLMRWRDELVAAPGRVADAVLDLLSDGSFDLVWANFAAAHKAGHSLWDPAAVVAVPLEAGQERVLREGLADVYRAVDTAMARILEALPPTADVVVFSPTGMDANTSRADLLPGMLDAVLAGRPAGAAPRRVRSPIWTLRSRVPIGLRDRVARLLPDALVADVATRLYLRAERRSDPALVVPGENKGYIRVNRKGRERHGVVSDAEVPELMDRIVDGLLSFSDPDGSPAIGRVERMSEMTTTGSCVDRLPDLVVHWGERPALRVTAAHSDRYGTVERPGVGSGRSGNHVDDAWAILMPRSGRVCQIPRQARVVDLGATACALLGAETHGLSGLPLLERSS